MRYSRYCIVGGRANRLLRSSSVISDFQHFQLQYVGTIPYDTHRMLHDIYLALSELKFVSKLNGKFISLTPDILYQRFTKFFLFLSPNATSWSFSLVTLFHNVLSVELQKTIRFDEYILPNNSTLSTLFSQTSAL